MNYSRGNQGKKGRVLGKFNKTGKDKSSISTHTLFLILENILTSEFSLFLRLRNREVVQAVGRKGS